MKSNPPSVICYGEILWDVFPNHKKIGGAPLNVALRLKSFGIATDIISRVGDDADGKAALAYLKENGLEGHLVQISQVHRTGAVNVILDPTGSASYTIVRLVAWDEITCTDMAVRAVKEADAFIFGSLACRGAISKNTLLKLLPNANYKIFDLNLRPPFYSIDLLLEMMQTSDFIKCNEKELREVCNAFWFNSPSVRKQMQFLAEKCNTNQICVTLGKDGAILLYEGCFYQNRGYTVKVADTVGAGDSFLAALISRLLQGNKPGAALNFATAVGALVAGKVGANPRLDPEEIEQMMQNG